MAFCRNTRVPKTSSGEVFALLALQESGMEEVDLLVPAMHIEHHAVVVGLCGASLVPPFILVLAGTIRREASTS